MFIFKGIPQNPHTTSWDDGIQYQGYKALTAGYHNITYDPPKFKDRVDAAIEFLVPRIDDFDTIAFRGFSGVVMGSILAYTLGKSMIYIRKGEVCHTIYKEAEGLGGPRVLIVDDFTSSGSTIGTIKGRIAIHFPSSQIVGIYLWKRDDNRRETLHGIPIWNTKEANKP